MHVIFFVSRNKDNKDVPGFKERKRVFFDDGRDAIRMFDEFVRKGVKGELCRWYRSVNSRDMERTRKAMICALVNADVFNPSNLESKAVSIAMKPENAADNQWLFDFDSDSIEKLEEFKEDLLSTPYNVDILRIQKTIHGYAVVVSHGFDTRALMSKWCNIVELKRDDMLLHAWKTNT